MKDRHISVNLNMYKNILSDSIKSNDNSESHKRHIVKLKNTINKLETKLAEVNLDEYKL